MESLLLALLLPPVFASAVARPHVLFMLADDLGFADVSFHWQQPSEAQIPTPHLQKLAEEGTVLKHYYVQPVCSPTRATILSGRRPSLGTCLIGLMPPRDDNDWKRPAAPRAGGFAR